VSRLAPLDKALVLILVPLWVVCFALGVRTQIRGGGVVQLGLSVEDADSHPTLTGDFPFYLPADLLEEAGLRAGDTLLRVGEADLRGAGSLTFTGIAREQSGRDLSVPLVYERDGEQRETALGLAPFSMFRASLAGSVVLVFSAVILLLRASPTPVVRAWFHAGLCCAFNTSYFADDRWEFYAWWALYVTTNCLAYPLLLRFAFLFPDGLAPESRWNRIWPWFFGVMGPWNLLFHSGRFTLATSGAFATIALGAVALASVITHKYRSTDRVGRRQIKWVVLGTYGAVLPMMLASVLIALDTRFGGLFYPSFWAFAVFPVFLLISVARYNLFDIDRLLSATASYNILVVVLVGGGLVVVPRVAEAASGVLGMDPGTGQIALSLLLAALVIPAHRRLRPQIDRLFFKERHALDNGVAELLPTLFACADARELTERAGAGLHRLLRPEACVVYASVEGSYVPVFVEGRAVPAAFEAGSPLIVCLRNRRAPLALGGAGRRPDQARLGPFDRAALETLQAEVVVPVHLGDALAAFLCFGPERSGDVYTSTDLSLLAAVAEAASAGLQRFDQAATLRQAQEMQEALRRYVPGAVAEQLSSGVEPTSGERDVSVLFVDIRGYTVFAEGRRAEEIFSTVNRYTETVSQIVQKHAGSVVEFNGDGMMAVFGAPRELAHKERAAVEAGREIVEAVGALTVEDAQGGQTKLSVGVGIATGEAFVGNIQAVDRMIWSAIGNTTNLAARLQRLTRDMDAVLMINHATWERAQPAAAGFEKRPDVPIRGRRETQDVYLLPMPARS